jgi:hypothetical protein
MADKVWWKCPEGADHEYLATRSERMSGMGCPFCSGKQVCSTNNLAVTHPAIAAQWHPNNNGARTATQVMAGSSRRVWWRCTTDNSHVWRSSIEDCVSEGCPHCPSSVALTDALVAEWHPTKNDTPTPS